MQLTLQIVITDESGSSRTEELMTIQKSGETRTAVLNNELQDKFVCWYPGFQSDGKGPAMAA